MDNRKFYGNLYDFSEEQKKRLNEAKNKADNSRNLEPETTENKAEQNKSRG